MAEEIVFGIRLTLDGKEVAGELRAQEAQLQRIGAAARQSNEQAAAAAERFVSSLRRQADTLGMTRTQTLAYEASQHNLTRAQQESVAQSLRAIDAYERKQQVLARVRFAAAAAGAAIGATLVAALKSSVAAAIEAEQAELKLEAVLRATGGAAGLTSQQIIAMSEDFQRRFGINDEAVKNSAAILLTFRQVAGDSFRDAMEIAANLSKVMGVDLRSAVLQLGKALEDPETGLTMLRRAGISFSEAQRQLIKDLVETGDHAQAITEVLRVMKEQGLDRVAEAMHQGLGGAAADLKNNWDDLLEALGRTQVIKGPVETTLGAISTKLLDIKNVIESGTWFDRWMMLSFGYSTERIRSMRAGRPEAGESDRNLVDIGSELVGRRALERRREAYETFMRQYRTDADKMADDLRKLMALYQSGAMTPEEFSAAQQRVRAKYTQKETVKGDDLESFVGALQRQLDLSGALTDTERVLYELRKRHWKNATPQLMQQAEHLARELDQRKAAKAALDAEIAALEEQDRIRQDVANKVGQMRTDALLAIDESVRKLETENDLIGASNTERERALMLMELERKRILLTAEAYEEYRTRINEALDVRAQREAQRKAVEDAQRAWERMNEDVARSLTDALLRGFEAGKDFARNFRDTLKNMFATLVLRPVIQWIVSPVTGAISAGLAGLGIPGLANAAGSSAAGSGLGALSSLSSLSSLGSGLAALPNAIFQDLGVRLGSQVIADIGNFGFGSPIIGSLISLAMGNTRGAIGSLALGSLGAAIGGPIGGFIGSAVGGLLGGGNKTPAYFTYADISGIASAEGFNALQAIAHSQKGDVWQFIAPQFRGVSSAVASVFAQMGQLAESLGVSVDRVRSAQVALTLRATGDSYAPNEQGALAGLQEAMSQLTDQLARKIVPGLDAFARAGETATQTLIRLAAEQEQLRARESQIASSLSSSVRSLPQQLGITALENARAALAISEARAPTERFDAARDLLAATYERAIAGDLEAVQTFPSVLQQALAIGRDVYASGPQFQQLFLEGNRQLNELLSRQQAIQADLLRDIDASILETARDQLGELKRGFRAVVDELAAVRAELRKLAVA